MSVTEDLTCREVVELMTAYLEGDLPATEAARVEAHVADCDGCETVVAEMRDTIRLTGMLTEDAFTPAQRDTLLAAFRDWAADPG
jgi:anti-sigma factor RsiW